MHILDQILDEGLKSIAIVGMAKNVGKTVTLNHLIHASLQKGIRIGLTSIGRDGERFDALTATDKPQIEVTRGTLFATAQQAREKTGIRAQVIADPEIKTILGNVYIYQAQEDGLVELVGPHSHSHLKRINTLMGDKADLILVDGAINRSSSAAPSITDGVILSTGAVIGRNVETVVEKTLYQVGAFSLPQVEDLKLRNISKQIIEKYNGGLIGEKFGIKPVEIKTALAGVGRFVEAINEDTRAMVLGGALTDMFLRQLETEVGSIYDLKIIIRDGTRLFLKPRTFNQFLLRGGKIRVLKPINLLALTVNSTTPQGSQLDPDKLCRSMAQAVGNIPVHDLMLGKSIIGGEG